MMKVDIYASQTKKGKHLHVPSGTDLDAFPWPDDLDPDVRKVKPFKLGHTIQAEPPMLGASYDDIAGQIEARGFAITATSITFTEGI